MTTQNTINLSNLSNLSKTELIEIINNLQSTSNRKLQLLTLLQSRPYTIQQCAEQLGTTPKNISSILTYLRKDNHIIITNPFQYKFILNNTYTSPETSEPIDPLTFKD